MKHTYKHVKDCNSPPPVLQNVHYNANNVFISQATTFTTLNQTKSTSSSLHISTSPKIQPDSYDSSFVDDYFLDLDLALLTLIEEGKITVCDFEFTYVSNSPDKPM